MTSRGKYINVNDIIIILTVFFSVSTITQQLLPFSMNRLIGVGILTFFFLDIIIVMNRKKLVYWFGVVVLFIISIILCKNSMNNIENYIYWMTTLLLLHKLTRKDSPTKLLEAFQKNSILIKYILYSYILVNLYCLSNPLCYEAYAGWGSRGYFKAFANTPHTFASASSLLVAIACLYVLYIRLDIMIVFGILISLFSVFQSGARIFLVSIVCTVVICALILFRDKGWRYCFYIVGGIAFLFLFVNTGMLEKCQAVFTNVENKNIDLVASFTNARSTIWAIDMNAVKQAGFLQKLFGYGFDYVKEINKIHYGMPIWAHNDFVQIIVSAGIIGLLIYLFSIFDVIKKLEAKNWLIKLMLGVYIILPAFWNGLYIYQHLVYSVLYLWLISNLYMKKEICFSTVFRKGLRKRL